MRRNTGRQPRRGDYIGRQEVVGFFEKLGQLSGGTFGVSVQQIFDHATGTVVALCTLDGERKAVDLPGTGQ